MSKTIVFKKEFEDKLKVLKIKTKFVNNVKDNCKRYDHSLQNRLKIMNEIAEWYNFIDCSFIWSDTPEGHNYWSGIANN